ncbi:MAG: BON domain-containing protein [Bdellovibrionales bacterium]
MSDNRPRYSEDRGDFQNRNRTRGDSRPISSYGAGASHTADYEGGWIGGELQDQGRFRQSHHAGRGPKGYQRSDERIHEEVCERLARDPDIDASEMEVEVQGGEVILRGTVPEREMKRRAEDLADQVYGVRDVHNQLRLMVDTFQNRAQTEIKEQSKERKSGKSARSTKE